MYEAGNNKAPVNRGSNNGMQSLDFRWTDISAGYKDNAFWAETKKS
jgi:hypothetical protein